MYGTFFFFGRYLCNFTGLAPPLSLSLSLSLTYYNTPSKRWSSEVSISPIHSRESSRLSPMAAAFATLVSYSFLSLFCLYGSPQTLAIENFDSLVTLTSPSVIQLIAFPFVTSRLYLTFSVAFSWHSQMWGLFRLHEESRRLEFWAPPTVAQSNSKDLLIHRLFARQRVLSLVRCALALPLLCWILRILRSRERVFPA